MLQTPYNAFVTLTQIDQYATWPFQVRLWPWPEVKFLSWLSMSRYIKFDVNQRKKAIAHCCKNYYPISIESCAISRKYFSHAFDHLCAFFSLPLEVKWSTWDQIGRMEHEMGSTVCVVRAALAHLVHKLPEEKISKLRKIGKMCPVMTSSDLTFDLTLKMIPRVKVSTNMCNIHASWSL